MDDSSKRAQIAPTTIVGLVLVIGGLILGFLFYFGIFGNKNLEERDLCRLSILSRATAPAVAGQALPLNCFTEKICITVEGDSAPSLSPFAIFGEKKSDCEQFAGEKNVVDIEVKINKDLADQGRTIKTIEKLYADAMFDCWTMTGEGKLEVFRGETDGAVSTTFDVLATLAGSDLGQIARTIKPQCIVCSRVALSDKLVKADEDYKVLSGLDFKKYLATQKVPDGSGLTYLQKFTDESVGSFANSEVNLKPVDEKFKALFSNQLAIIFMQIKTEGTPEDIAKEAAFLTGATIGGGLITTPLGKATGVLGGVFLTLGGSGLAYLGAENIAKENQAISLASCNEYEKDNKKASLGCSLIKPVKWEINEVNSLCSGGIKGNL